MPDPSYRITFVIERLLPGADDYEEIGFGSSTGQATIDGALYRMQSDIQNREWETTNDMPDPKAAENV